MGKTALVLCCAMALCGPALAAGPPDWWDQHWQWRLVVEVVPASRRAGLNTARLELGDQGRLCQPDGRDVRVVSSAGALVPHRVEVEQGRGLAVLFELSGDLTRYYVYYGNPAAPKAESAWKEQLGGLTLETRPLNSTVTSPSGLLKEVQSKTVPYGKKPWGQIWDLENPFGPDDRYLSIYEGTLYLPETGRYVFAVNADDVGYFAVQGLANPMCWRRPGEMSQNWIDPRQPRGHRAISAKKGIYRISFYQAENWGGQFAALGWQTPSSKQIVAVPPEAFVRYVPAEVIGREERTGKLSAFFSVRLLHNLQFNSQRVLFPLLRVESRMTQRQKAAGLQDGWRFADGSTAAGAVVERYFRPAPQQTVTLTVSARDGSRATITRTVRVGGTRVLPMTVHLQVQGTGALVARDRPVQLRILALCEGTDELTYRLETVVAAGDGPPAVRSSRPLRLKPVPVGQASAGSGAAGVSGRRSRRPGRARAAPPEPAAQPWSEVVETFEAAAAQTRVRVRLSFLGVEIVSRKVAILGTDTDVPGLHFDASENLRDADGSLVVLRVADLRREGAPERVPYDPATGVVNVLVLDQMLGGPAGQSPETNFVGYLARLLEARYPGLDFQCRRSAPPPEADALPAAGFLHLQRLLATSRPNLVLLVLPPESVVNGVPLKEFRDYLTASLDQILARTRAEAVVVTPPPVPLAPDSSAAYARAAKEVGLRKGLPVVDLYSRFLLMENWIGLFQSLEGRYPSYSLYPNERGQEEVAEAVYAAVVEHLDGVLSAGSRRFASRSGRAR